MGKSNKKKFIDKKNASTFHLLHRSQRDVDNDQGGSSMVLWPSPDNLAETNQKVLSGETTNTSKTMNTIKQQLGGLVDDYDYDQHLKPITGSGILLDNHGKLNTKERDVRSSSITQQEDNVKEVPRQLESIALTPDCMEADVAQALFGEFDDGDFEEILDDFCLTAAEEPDEEEGSQEFDYDAHIRNLMERAKKQTRDEYDGVPVEDHEAGRQDYSFFAKAKPLGARGDHDDDESGEFYDDDDLLDTPGIVSALNPEEEKALCDKFEQTLAEYDSDEVGDLDEECEEICGDRPLEGDILLETAMDEFLEEKKDEIFMEGTRHLAEKRRTGGSSFAALVGKQLVHASDLNDDTEELAVHEEAPLEEQLQDADDTLANPIMEPPQEEVLIDGKSYFSERTRNPWDCESILSTYSNLDNNPVTIESKRRKKKKQQQRQVSPVETLPEDEPVHIKLSAKTGLPIRYIEDDYEGDDDTIISRNRGEARNKKETKEEKKARKLAVKKEREIARIQKKMMKEAFKDEFALRSEDAADDMGGKSVFRYS